MVSFGSTDIVSKMKFSRQPLGWDCLHLGPSCLWQLAKTCHTPMPAPGAQTYDLQLIQTQGGEVSSTVVFGRHSWQLGRPCLMVDVVVGLIWA